MLESEHLHMRCCAHILSLVVKDGLKEVEKSVARIRFGWFLTGFENLVATYSQTHETLHARQF